MSHHRSTFFLGLGSAIALVAALASPAHAQTPSDAAAAKLEASERFQRGISLYEAGNLNAALAEFERANSVQPHPVVLYNIGLTCAALERPVDAETALSKLVAAPGGLSSDRLANAKRVLAEQQAKVGAVDVKVTVDGAQIEIDGVIVGVTPLKAPIRLSTGTHVVGALAIGHAPVRKGVTVAAGVTSPITLEPPIIEGRLAHLTVQSSLPGASLFVDGEMVAKTPLPASLSLLAGPHTLVLRRAGYRDASTSVVLGEGATGEVRLEPEEDTVGVRVRGGDLRLEISETRANVSIDGVSHGLYVAPIRLAAGPHRLLVDRAGFRPFDRDINITEGKETTLNLILEPTPETRVTYAADANRSRNNAYITMGVGGGVALAAGGFLLWNLTNKASAQEGFDALFDDCMSGAEKPEVCQQLANRNSTVNTAHSLDVVGGVGLGLGLIAVGTGLTMLLSADNPNKYDAKVSDTLALRPVIDLDGSKGYFGLQGTF